MALSSSLPTSLSSSCHGSHSTELSLSRAQSSNSETTFHKQNSHRLPREDPRKKEYVKKKKKRKKKKENKKKSSWAQLKSLFLCRIAGLSYILDPSKNRTRVKFKDVSHGDNRSTNQNQRRTASIYASSSKGRLHLRRIPSCYECRAISQPRRGLTPRRIISCPECGDAFSKLESLERHQTVRHAVSELGPEDSGRNIVEIIFKSSWQTKDAPLCQIDRILKVHNSQKTISRFEDYRNSIKTRSTGKKNPRCAADGNELLRFHCCNVFCNLGAHGRSSLCSSSSSSSVPPCVVCMIIRYGFGRARYEPGKGIRTTAISGKATDESIGGVKRRAMLVCRVIAGRVKMIDEEIGSQEDGFDSMTTDRHALSNVEELFVSNPRAILPCFVVVFRVSAA